MSQRFGAVKKNPPLDQVNTKSVKVKRLYWNMAIPDERKAAIQYLSQIALENQEVKGSKKPPILKFHLDSRTTLCGEFDCETFADNLAHGSDLDCIHFGKAGRDADFVEISKIKGLTALHC